MCHGPARCTVAIARISPVTSDPATSQRRSPELAKNKREHRVYLSSVEVSLLREQLLARAPGTNLVFPTPEGGSWNRFRFGDRLWRRSVAAAARHDRDATSGRPSAFDGFTFHWLRHTAGSLMAAAGYDPAVAAERMRHTDGGALFLRTYRHLYEGEKRVHADAPRRVRPRELGQGMDIGPWESVGMAQRSRFRGWAHLGSNQGPLACEASALPLSYAPGRCKASGACARSTARQEASGATGSRAAATPGRPAPIRTAAAESEAVECGPGVSAGCEREDGAQGLGRRARAPG